MRIKLLTLVLLANCFTQAMAANTIPPTKCPSVKAIQNVGISSEMRLNSNLRWYGQ